MRARLHHEVTGDPDAPVLVFGPSLGTELALFDPQLPAFADSWRIVRFDLRGHGRSPTPEGPYSVGDLADDVVGLLDELDITEFCYVGVSIGGAIGLSLGINLGRELQSLVVCASAAQFADPESWPVRGAKVRAEGTAFLEPSRTGTWFTPEFAQRAPDDAQRLIDMLRRTRPEGYAGCCEAIGAFDVRDRLQEITASTLVLAGSADPATPPDMCREIADGIAGAGFDVIPDAAHLLNVERPDLVNAAITEHLSGS